MIQTKYFKTEHEAREWIAKHERHYACTLVFVNNGYGEEYKPLHRIA